MKTFIQILDDRAHWKFTAESRPNFAPDIVLIDVTDMRPQPEERWEYSDGVFVPPTELRIEDAE